VRLQCRETRHGIVIATVLLALVALLGMAAITVDLGRAVVAAQKAQSVADAAAMAAVAYLPDTDVGDYRMESVIAANNEAMIWPPVNINSDEDVTYYGPGDEVPDHGVLESGQYAITVTAHVNEEYGFAKLAGQEKLQLTRTATAKVRTIHGALPALFASDDTSSHTSITINGSGAHIEGDTHANSRVTINGSNHLFTGPVEYRNRITINGSNNVLEGGYHEGNILSYPVDYTWDDFLPWDYEVSDIRFNGSGGSMEFGHVHVLGNVTVNGSSFRGRNGLLMVEGNVIFNGSNHSLENVTIIAKGKITFNGACQEVTPYTENLTLLSLSSNSTAITFNGSNQDSHGTFFAPNGGITYNGSSQRHQHGSIIAKKITMNGSNHYVHGTESGSAGRKVVQLIR